MKLTVQNILKVVKQYDYYYRGGTGRGDIDEALAEVLYKVFAKGKKADEAIKELL